jgi:ribosomal protein S18 acetylase RimI-like enzyme
MLFAGFRRLKSLGADTAKLGVDADNPTGALGLYERVGFHTDATRIVFKKEI